VNRSILRFFLKGHFSQFPRAQPIQGETDIDDNTLVDGWVIVVMPGDITGATNNIPDGIVDGIDIAVVCRAYGSEPGDENWNPDADINNDGIIGGIDVATVCRQFGKTDL